MPALAMAKRDTGRRLHSHAVVADGNQTKLCAYLSAIFLGGLVLNATMGWWWADPVAALGIAALALNEGRERGEAMPAATDPKSPTQRTASQRW